MPQTAVFPFPVMDYQSCIHRVSVYIAKDLQKLAKPLDDLRKKAFAPDMPRIPMCAVIGHREYAHDPLHDPRQRFPGPRTDHEMVMIAHDAEILDSEAVSLPGAPNHLKEYILHAFLVQDVFLAVCPSGDVVECAVPE
jgi:hypothetical protein